jgi:methyl-accepting chemotaxis protein
MGQLSKATQQNASASEELAATSEELSGQAEQLQQSVAFFHTGEDDDLIARASDLPLTAGRNALSRPAVPRPARIATAVRSDTNHFRPY